MKTQDIVAVVAGFLSIFIACGIYYVFKGDHDAAVVAVLLGLFGMAAIGKGIKVDSLW